MYKPILSTDEIQLLRNAFAAKLISASFGAGLDSTAYLCMFHAAGIRPDIITFSDTGAEKKLTMIHLQKMNQLVQSWGWPEIMILKKKTLPSTPYDDLYGNCVDNQTLPSLAFGFKSCSLKWKVSVQRTAIIGAKSGPNKCHPHPIWEESQRTGQRISVVIGYDNGKADLRRSKNLSESDEFFDYVYPLQIVKWDRQDCYNAVEAYLGADMIPCKSACFFCPASKIWELYWLAANEPELLNRALHMEYVALTGRHSRFDTVEFGDTWENLVKNADRFPSSNTTVGLGRSFSWCQWAWTNKVVDEHFKVLTDPISASIFQSMADTLRNSDNALDVRYKQRKVIEIAPVLAGNS